MPPNSYEVIVDPGNAGKFIVGNRYKFKKKLGGGAYGVVAMFTDSETIVDDGKGNMVPMEVAVKKTTNAFQDVIDSKRTLRELKLLSHVSHDNIVRLMEVLPSACSAKEQADVYAVMERLDTDLHQIIRSPQALTDEHYQYFMYQLLCGLQYLHSCDIIHRDLKPGNLLVNKNCDLKICDFGLARIKGDVGTETEGDPLTEYVITRWYRPPELILTRSYDESIDMWSAGACRLLPVGGGGYRLRAQVWVGTESGGPGGGTDRAAQGPSWRSC
jgi:serine/threonine protein kinase